MPIPYPNISQSATLAKGTTTVKADGGMMIAIKGSEGSVHRAREARYNAGNAVAHGLPYEAAIAAITVNPARIFGLDSQFGGLRPGVAADVVVWTGDPLESDPLCPYQPREQVLAAH